MKHTLFSSTSPRFLGHQVPGPSGPVTDPPACPLYLIRRVSPEGPTPLPRPTAAHWNIARRPGAPCPGRQGTPCPTGHPRPIHSIQWQVFLFLRTTSDRKCAERVDVDGDTHQSTPTTPPRRRCLFFSSFRFPRNVPRPSRPSPIHSHHPPAPRIHVFRLNRYPVDKTIKIKNGIKKRKTKRARLFGPLRCRRFDRPIA